MKGRGPGGLSSGNAEGKESREIQEVVSPSLLRGVNVGEEKGSV